MLIVEFEEIELDACPDCKGIWFDAQELRELFELVGAPEHVRDLENQLERLGPRHSTSILSPLSRPDRAGACSDERRRVDLGPVSTRSWTVVRQGRVGVRCSSHCWAKRATPWWTYANISDNFAAASDSGDSAE